ncbi:cytochrome c-type biogenesis protein CcmF, partial [mine drainage metagenome]
NPAVAGQFVMVATSMGCLVTSFVQNDFTVRYVAANSNSQLPLFYRVAGVWGAHSGSLLLWIFLLGCWTVATAFGTARLPKQFSARVLGVLGAISFGFLLYTLLTSNPFVRLTSPWPDGLGLNPLLQDPGLAAHPPMLYTGYVGLSVAFAFACAALLEGKLDREWARWARPWTTAAWAFLTCGIVLGSWWAYYTLGWGGFWFWDPVENASFMPWLMATALIHSLAVTENAGCSRVGRCCWRCSDSRSA